MELAADVDPVRVGRDGGDDVIGGRRPAGVERAGAQRERGEVGAGGRVDAGEVTAQVEATVADGERVDRAGDRVLERGQRTGRGGHRGEAVARGAVDRRERAAEVNVVGRRVDGHRGDRTVGRRRPAQQRAGLGVDRGEAAPPYFLLGPVDRRERAAHIDRVAVVGHRVDAAVEGRHLLRCVGGGRDGSLGAGPEREHGDGGCGRDGGNSRNGRFRHKCLKEDFTHGRDPIRIVVVRRLI